MILSYKLESTTYCYSKHNNSELHCTWTWVTKEVKHTWQTDTLGHLNQRQVKVTSTSSLNPLHTLFVVPPPFYSRIRFTWMWALRNRILTSLVHGNVFLVRLFWMWWSWRVCDCFSCTTAVGLADPFFLSLTAAAVGKVVSSWTVALPWVVVLEVVMFNDWLSFGVNCFSFLLSTWSIFSLTAVSFRLSSNKN